MKQQYNTALYLRLSRDYELKSESGSIGTQRDILTQYCNEQNLCIINEYVYIKLQSLIQHRGIIKKYALVV